MPAGDDGEEVRVLAGSVSQLTVSPGPHPPYGAIPGRSLSQETPDERRSFRLDGPASRFMNYELDNPRGSGKSQVGQDVQIKPRGSAYSPLTPKSGEVPRVYSIHSPDRSFGQPLRGRSSSFQGAGPVHPLPPTVECPKAFGSKDFLYFLYCVRVVQKIKRNGKRQLRVIYVTKDTLYVCEANKANRTRRSVKIWEIAHWYRQETDDPKTPHELLVMTSEEEPSLLFDQAPHKLNPDHNIDACINAVNACRLHYGHPALEIEHVPRELGLEGLRAKGNFKKGKQYQYPNTKMWLKRAKEAEARITNIPRNRDQCLLSGQLADTMNPISINDVKDALLRAQFTPVFQDKETSVFFLDYVVKTNRFQPSTRRVIAITQEALWQVSPSTQKPFHRTVTRCIPLNQISEVRIAEGIVGIRIPHQYDMQIQPESAASLHDFKSTIQALTSVPVTTVQSKRELGLKLSSRREWKQPLFIEPLRLPTRHYDIIPTSSSNRYANLSSEDMEPRRYHLTSPKTLAERHRKPLPPPPLTQAMKELNMFSKSPRLSREQEDMPDDESTSQEEEAGNDGNEEGSSSASGEDDDDEGYVDEEKEMEREKEKMDNDKAPVTHTPRARQGSTDQQDEPPVRKTMEAASRQSSEAPDGQTAKGTSPLIPRATTSPASSLPPKQPLFSPLSAVSMSPPGSTHSSKPPSAVSPPTAPSAPQHTESPAPATSPLGIPQVNPTAAEVRAIVEKFYMQHHPDKLGILDKLMAKHSGKEAKMLRDYQAKYRFYNFYATISGAAPMSPCDLEGEGKGEKPPVPQPNFREEAETSVSTQAQDLQGANNPTAQTAQGESDMRFMVTQLAAQMEKLMGRLEAKEAPAQEPTQLVPQEAVLSTSSTTSGSNSSSSSSSSNSGSAGSKAKGVKGVDIPAIVLTPTPAKGDTSSDDASQGDASADGSVSSHVSPKREGDEASSSLTTDVGKLQQEVRDKNNQLIELRFEVDRLTSQNKQLTEENNAWVKKHHGLTEKKEIQSEVRKKAPAMSPTASPSPNPAAPLLRAHSLELPIRGTPRLAPRSAAASPQLSKHPISPRLTDEEARSRISSPRRVNMTLRRTQTSQDVTEKHDDCDRDRVDPDQLARLRRAALALHQHHQPHPRPATPPSPLSAAVALSRDGSSRAVGSQRPARWPADSMPQAPSRLMEIPSALTLSSPVIPLARSGDEKEALKEVLLGHVRGRKDSRDSDTDKPGKTSTTSTPTTLAGRSYSPPPEPPPTPPTPQPPPSPPPPAPLIRTPPPMEWVLRSASATNDPPIFATDSPGRTTSAHNTSRGPFQTPQPQSPAPLPHRPASPTQPTLPPPGVPGAGRLVIVDTTHSAHQVPLTFRRFLRRHSFDVPAIVLGSHPEPPPSAENVAYALQWLMDDAQPGDSLVLVCIGGGTAVEGYLTAASSLSPGVKLTVLIDDPSAPPPPLPYILIPDHDVIECDEAMLITASLQVIQLRPQPESVVEEAQLTTAFVTAFNRNPVLTLPQLVNDMQALLCSSGTRGTPALYLTRPPSASETFHIVNGHSRGISSALTGKAVLPSMVCPPLGTLPVGAWGGEQQHPPHPQHQQPHQPPHPASTPPPSVHQPTPSIQSHQPPPPPPPQPKLPARRMNWNALRSISFDPLSPLS